MRFAAQSLMEVLCGFVYDVLPPEGTPIPEDFYTQQRTFVEDVLPWTGCPKFPDAKSKI